MKLAELVLMIFGVFLVADSFFFHAIVFNYWIFGLQWFDPYLNHWMIGMIFLLIGAIGWWKD